MHTVNLYNLHLHNFTDYRFCIFDAVSVSGDSLDTPYAFYFTTSPTITNTATVSGIVGANPFGAMIFLFDSNPFEEDESDWTEWTVAPPASGAYTVDYVPAGIYWPLVIKNMYLDEDGDIDIQNGSELAYYDSNNDYRPDSILVSPGAIISGIDMTLHDVFTQTARNPIPDLELIVQNWSSDAQLIMFGGDELYPNGESLFWQFMYFSPSLMNFSQWLTVGDLVASMRIDSFVVDTTALPLNWLDSDTIMSIAESNGGFDYRQLYPDVEIYGSCGYFTPQFEKYLEKFEYKNSISKNVLDVQTAVWNIEYESGLTLESLFFLIDAVDGTILNLPVTAANAEQKALQLAQTWALDASLQNISNQWAPVDTSGTSELWSCIYYSSQKDSLYAVTLWGLLPFYSGPVGILPTDTLTIKLGWIDSDMAVDIAEFNGGSDYRQNNIQVHVSAALGKWDDIVYPDSIVWKFTYESSTANTLEIFIDAYTGDFINGIENTNNANTPNTFVLEQNYPNPFNPKTTFEFNLPTVAEVEIKIYNLAGQEVGFINKGTMSAGNQKIIWNAENLPSGIYFYKIIAGEFSDIKKCILIK